MTAPLRVLLVEDNPGDVELVRQVFEESGGAVDLTVVGDGQQALAYLLRQAPHEQALRPHLTVLDLNLPRVPGLSVLAEIKRQAALRAVPVVVLATAGSAADVGNTYELGGSCFIEKPVGLEAMLTVVRTLRDFWLTAAKLP